MADILTKEKRSWNMSRIGRKDTKPEIAVRKQLHSLGFRFRLHNTDLSGKPDIVLKKYKTAVFVHGCFWHRHKNCKYAYNPKSRTSFWQKKFEVNIKRDQQVRGQLTSLGWKQMVIWECETKNKDLLTEIIEDFFTMRLS
jgi:DNA mismatch endonuclease (patch repair protein)